MKKEFSFYEFTGILVPSVVLMFFLNILISDIYGREYIDFSKIGDSLVFLILCYGFGHILHSLGNFFEWIFWGIFGGKPTSWLIKGNRFKGMLLSVQDAEKVTRKIYSQFGEDKDRDYGRIVYNVLFQEKKTARIDIFGANYSMFRALTVSFLILTIACIFHYSLYLCALPLAFAILSLFRMVRFARHYATEIFITYMNLSEN